MTGPLTFGAVAAAIWTLTAALALRAADATLAVAAVAAVAVLLAWFAVLHSDEASSGLGPAAATATVSLAIARRQPWSTVLPLLAAQVVGSVLGGLAALGLDDRLGPTLVVADPDPVVAGVVGMLAGLLAAWAWFAIDGDGPVVLTVVPLVAGGSLGAVTLAAAAHPAVLIGLATADLLPWDVAGVAAAAALGGAVLGAYGIAAIAPRTSHGM